ncbi:RagB/SusD family nutrient uptake outer membrane protein [Solitalea sp. MAHUQ-68]|uniref:RagB/SusD family nutrient uptake outer membrane protein n=1 Tax=Solitalea agri TaxID=2953739 RepID=A0A9X2JEB4_9SPHI|nr:RagB/SusD family nutrient uptake outer membrane protein [Solitalea agri]MCO4294564.1 RagB/SusD family nutrient uptake outer membrane protein [Solitalea agri]
MKRNYINLILTAAALLGLASCQNFLDVKPEDQLLEQTVFSNKQGVNLALNGLYTRMAGGSLYGENLTLSTVEVLGQRYNLNSLNGAFYPASQYAYAESSVTGRTGAIWNEAYATIMNINHFLKNLDVNPNLIDAKTDSIYRGEVIAMRAMLHFDVLRLFGPRYSTADSTQISIPYYDKVENVARPLLPANEVMKNIVTDLNTAEKLLKSDPVITAGVMSTTTSTDMMMNRNYRFNYFAVKALQARVNLYRGDKALALAAAKIVIQDASKFPWTTFANSNEKVNPDRIFSTEMILGAFTTQLYSAHNRLFLETLEDNTILAPTDKILKSVFEIDDSGAGVGARDYRLRLNWEQPSSTSTKPYRTFSKYADISKKTLGFRNTIPLLKISEMYYIAAECESDQNQALTYLNTVRTNRGLDALTSAPNLQNELLKEYKKEFYGEGQLFFYYKRTNTASIQSGVDGAPAIAMNASTYVVPLPLSESQYH